MSSLQVLFFYFDIVIGWCFDEAQFNELLEKYSPPRDSGVITEYCFMYPESEILKIELVDVKYRYIIYQFVKIFKSFFYICSFA